MCGAECPPRRIHPSFPINDVNRNIISAHTNEMSKRIPPQLPRPVAGIVNEIGVGVSCKEIFVEFLSMGLIMEIALNDLRFAERSNIQQRTGKQLHLHGVKFP